MNPIVQEEFAQLSPGYFNSAYLGPAPLRAQEAGRTAIERSGNPIQFPYEEWRPLPDLLRKEISNVLSPKFTSEHVSLHSAVSEVISYVSLGYPFQSGDHVVLMEGDYPSDVLPWILNQRRSGYELTRLPSELFIAPNELEKHLPAQTKVLCMTHVMFNTGRKNAIRDIGRLCQQRGILFVVDVTQSLGAITLADEDVEHIDVLNGATYKWLLGPYGHAFAAWSDQALEKVDNVHLSWQTSVSATRAGDLLNYNIQALPGARKFDRGQAPNVVSTKMLMASLSLFQEVGLGPISAHNGRIVDQFLAGLPGDRYELVTPRDHRARIVCLRTRDIDSAQLENVLREKQIDASVREGNLRLSFHFYNTEEQVENLLKVLTDL